jgi:hypothetical protein
MQTRAYTGAEFEKTMAKQGWRLVTVSPKLQWKGVGRNNIQKIKSVGYDPKNFGLTSESFLEKYDLFHPVSKKYREVKKYYISQISDWTLYSEPYFKIATSSQKKLVDTKTYNNFVDKFYNFNLKSGLISNIQKQMTRLTEGIQFIDGFVPKSELEFRTVVLDGWSGYKRITIQFRKK